MHHSDLNDQEWETLKPLVKQTAGRPREHDIRQVLNALFYLNRTGCQWRYLPKEYPKWDTVYGYFRRWKKQGTLENLVNSLRRQVRVTCGKKTRTECRDY